LVWKRQTRPLLSPSVSSSAEPTGSKATLFSNATGRTASATALLHTPVMATTPSTSISLRAAETPAVGVVSSSATTISNGRPSTPPWALIWAAAALAAVSSSLP